MLANGFYLDPVFGYMRENYKHFIKVSYTLKLDFEDGSSYQTIGTMKYFPDDISRDANSMYSSYMIAINDQAVWVAVVK